jgi:hypothetical protein
MPTIKKPNQHFDATTYTGNGGTLSVTNAGGFQPDMVWVKSRSNSGTNNLITDVARGNKGLFPNLTEGDSTGRYCTLLSNGFQFVGTAGDDGNTSGWTYVGWQWKAGGATTVNTSGSISSNVSVNTTAGFSVVTYTGTGANATVGHGLGVAPRMIIAKRRNTTQDWGVYHASIGNTGALALNLSIATDTNSAYFSNTSPSSSVFSLGSGGAFNASTGTYVAYCWAEVEGYSKFGSYTGNGSADGVFVYLGFRPRFVLIKNSSGGATSSLQGWIMMDTSRSTYNQTADALFTNNSNASSSSSTYAIDILSNGFKTRGTDGAVNESSATYIYMAFAEAPFKFSNAR